MLRASPVDYPGVTVGLLLMTIGGDSMATAAEGLDRAFAYLEKVGPMKKSDFARLVMGLGHRRKVNPGTITNILTVAEYRGYLLSEDETGRLAAFGRRQVEEVKE
jgi:hypothetical protein